MRENRTTIRRQRRGLGEPTHEPRIGYKSSDWKGKAPESMMVQFQDPNPHHPPWYVGVTRDEAGSTHNQGRVSQR